MTLIIKKSPSVESNELGVVDVACQLMITITLGTLLLIFIHVMSRQRWMLFPFEKVGRYSYVLYLSHIIALDYLKETHNALMYFLWTTGFFIVLLLIEKFTTAILKMVMERTERKND